jgi:DeoR family transcriptional regulator, catabolite repression regulator
LTARQLQIIELVRKNAPITSEQIAEKLSLSRPTIRSDLAVLVMLGYIDAKPKVGYTPGQAFQPELAAFRKLNDWKVQDVQGIPSIIRDTATVNDAVVTLFVDNVGSLIVTGEDGLLSGVVSRKDLLKFTLGNPNAGAMPVSMVMTRHPNVVTVTPDDSVVDAARRMIHTDVDSLPVVIPSSFKEDGWEPVGRITKTTLTKLLIELASTLRE